jgi:hypothetical protein
MPATGAPFNTPPHQRGYVHITTNTTTAVLAGPGILAAVVVNSGGGNNNLATVYDANNGTTTPVAVIDTGARGTLLYELRVQNGITVVTGGGANVPDLTVVFS